MSAAWGRIRSLGERGSLWSIGAVITVVASRAQLLPPAQSAPVWLRLLMLIAGRLPTASVSEGFAPRGVVAAPTTRHLPVALAASAAVPPSREWASPIEPDVTVATVLSKRFADVPVGQGAGTRLNLGGTQLDPSRIALPPAAVLPDEWDVERAARALPPDAVELLKREFAVPRGARPLVGEWLYQQMCLEPVVILTQRPGRATDEAGELAAQLDWWNWSQHVAMHDLVEGVDWWFRRPIVVLSPQTASALPWADQVPVRLVVAVGFSTWMSPARHRWKSAPQVLMLNQRSTDVSDFREWFDNTSFGEVSIPGVRNTRKGGLTLTAFGEPASAFTDVEDDEWDL